MGSRGLITTGHSAASTLGEDSRNSNSTKGKVTLGLKNLDSRERPASRRMGRRRVIVAYCTQPIGNAAFPAVLVLFGINLAIGL